MTWDARTTRACLVLATFSLAAAALNIGWPRLTTLTETSVPLAILASILPVLFYVPIYVLFHWAVRRWGWTLDEWSFNLRGRAWVSLTAATIVLVVVSRPWQWENVSFSQFGNETFGVGVGVALFEAYARLGEELAYRALAPLLCLRIFRGSRFAYPLAILLPSAAFALVHTRQLGMLPWLFLASLLLTALVVWTQSLAVSFGMHAATGGGILAAVLGLGVWLVAALYNERAKRHCAEAWHAPGKALPE